METKFLIDIQTEIKNLQKREREILKTLEEKQDLNIKERQLFQNKLKTTSDVEFMKEVLTAKSVVGTPKYCWQEFYLLCENPNITDEIIDLLLEKEAYYMIVSMLLLNDGVNYQSTKRILKHRYFRDLKRYFKDKKK